MRRLRIHGDNIVECERTLALIGEALQEAPVAIADSAIYKPTYFFAASDICIELLSGHGRWGMDIADVILKAGGTLRESADSYITEVVDGIESIMIAIEYCSALPAGNNAWQRNGRAMAAVQAGIPYLYFAEIGGLELNENRQPKASRYPNPVVPYSYISCSKHNNTLCLPVYMPHPSMSSELAAKFRSIFGKTDALQILKGILTGNDYSDSIDGLKQKGLQLVRMLADDRRRVDTLRGDEWNKVLNSDSPAAWLIQKTQPAWHKSVESKVATTDTFKSLLQYVISLPCYGIGANKLPICLLSCNQVAMLKEHLRSLYPDTDIQIAKDKPLVVVWITGFKPRGDDSRPDRGLSPLAKMVVGSSANVMAVVYGPAKTATWDSCKLSLQSLSEDNGLWQSIVNICDYVLIDSATCDTKLFYATNHTANTTSSVVSFKAEDVVPEFSEHDTDTAIHQIFARKEQYGVFECMCNPPGGDWSGISYFANNGDELRWTSLPRVSDVGGKRPDHVVLYKDEQRDSLIIIESKKVARDLENNIGRDLKRYMVALYSTMPNAIKHESDDWCRYDGEQPIIKPHKVVSVGAFIYQNNSSLSDHMTRGELDCVMAFEFQKQKCVLHIKSNRSASFLKKLVKQIALGLDGLVIKIH